MSRNNYGVDVMAQGKEWSARVEGYQLALGNGATLRSRAKAEIKRNDTAIDALKDCLNGEESIAELKARNEVVKSALKKSLAEQAAWAWSDHEQKWAQTMLKLADETARVQATRMLYSAQYGMDVSVDWARSVVKALGLDTLGNATVRQFVGTGYSDANKATKSSVLKAYMAWNVRQCRANGLKAYTFASDIVEMYAKKPAKRT